MLDVAPVSDVIEILSLETFERLNAASITVVTVRNCDAVKVLTDAAITILQQAICKILLYL